MVGNLSLYFHIRISASRDPTPSHLILSPSSQLIASLQTQFTHPAPALFRRPAQQETADD
jgi:hypothetical protein